MEKLFQLVIEVLMWRCQLTELLKQGQNLKTKVMANKKLSFTKEPSNYWEW